MRFFQKTFLVSDTAMEIVLGLSFLIFGKVEINFANWKLNRKTYILDEALPITKKVQIINWKEFLTAALALNEEVFVVYMAYLWAKMLIHLA